MNRKLKLLMLLSLVLLLSGCWNRRELNELGIAVGMGIDKVGDEFLVTVQVVNPGEVAPTKGGSTRSPVSTYESQGSTIMEAIRRMSVVAPRKIYFAHLRMLVLGEKLAREGIGEALDFLSRDQEFRTDFYIVVAKNRKAEQVLKVLVPVEKLPAQQLFAKLQMSEKTWAATGTIKLDELINNMVSEGKEASVTGVKVIGGLSIGNQKTNVEMVDSPAKLVYTGMSVFRKDKLIGWLNETESKGYNYTQGKVKSTVIEFPCGKKGTLAVEAIRTDKKIKGRLVRGRPEFDVEIKIEGNVADVECAKLDLTKPQTIYQLEKKTEKDVTTVVSSAVKKAQKTYKVDIFGFGEVLHRAEPKAWKKLKKDWNSEFTDAVVHVKVDVKIRRVGTTGNSFLKELKKEE